MGRHLDERVGAQIYLQNTIRPISCAAMTVMTDVCSGNTASKDSNPILKLPNGVGKDSGVVVS